MKKQQEEAEQLAQLKAEYDYKLNIAIHLGLSPDQIGYYQRIASEDGYRVAIAALDRYINAAQANRAAETKLQEQFREQEERKKEEERKRQEEEEKNRKEALAAALKKDAETEAKDFISKHRYGALLICLALIIDINVLIIELSLLLLQGVTFGLDFVSPPIGVLGHLVITAMELFLGDFSLAFTIFAARVNSDPDVQHYLNLNPLDGYGE